MTLPLTAVAEYVHSKIELGLVENYFRVPSNKPGAHRSRVVRVHPNIWLRVMEPEIRRIADVERVAIVAKCRDGRWLVDICFKKGVPGDYI